MTKKAPGTRGRNTNPKRFEDRTSIEYLRDTYEIGYQAFKSSKDESRIVWDLYHNRHYSEEQLSELANRGQPAETFNIVKAFSRLLVGYYSTLINKISTIPVGEEDIITSTLLNDVIDHALRDNSFAEEGEKIKLDGILSGLMVAYVDVEPTGETDQFGRPINRIVLEHVHESEVVLDPLSRREDYTDARFIHRFRWLSEEGAIAMFGKAKVKPMIDNYNVTADPSADFELHHETEYGIYRYHENYLIIHSIVIDEQGDSWSIFWHDETIIQKDKITHKLVKFPYRVVKTHTSQEPEYYGVFREVIEPQKALDQALIKLQLMVNTSRAFVQEGAVENMADFTNSYNRVSAVIPVLQLEGIKIEHQSREAQELYVVIDRCLQRIQRVLGINDSFLGQAFASDSGRKVKLQQNASIIALRYFTAKVETFYRFLGWDMANLIRQYFRATQVIRIADDTTGYRWAELNKPATMWSGQTDPNGQPTLGPDGQPIMQLAYEEVLDPATGEPMEDEEGNIIIAPIPTEESEIAFTNVDIEIVSTAYNDEDEKNQLLLETVLSGMVGSLLSQVNPAGFFQAAGLSIMSAKTKNSPEIAQIFKQTAQMLGANQEAQQQASMMAQGEPGQLNQTPRSETLSLPQEG
jgi:hypothetical protein